MKNRVLLVLFSFISLNLQAQFNYYLDTISFEDVYPNLEMDTSVQNIWEIGRPQKIYFDSAHSSLTAIVTDTVNNYPINNHSFFDVKTGYFNYGSFYAYDVFLGINHKYDTDSLLDGCYITVSHDYGQTWTNIMNDSASYSYGGYWCITPRDGFNENMYNNYADSLFNGEWGFSGKSDGWGWSSFGWHECPVKSPPSTAPDTMIVRFNFISDSIDTNKEGWMIDNIVLFAIPLGGNVEVAKQEELKVYPNPSSDLITVQLKRPYQEVELFLYSLEGVLLKKNKFENTRLGEMNVSDLPRGAYLLRGKCDGTDLRTKIVSVF